MEMVPAAELVSVVTMPPKRKRKVSAGTVAASAPPSHDESRATEVRAIESAEDEAPTVCGCTSTFRSRLLQKQV